MLVDDVEDVVLAAAPGFFCESAETVVSPVDALSTGVVADGAMAVVLVVAELDAAAALSLFAASFRAHATARLRTPPMTTARRTADKVGPAEGSKQRFIDMLVHSCTLPRRVIAQRVVPSVGTLYSIRILSISGFLRTRMSSTSDLSSRSERRVPIATEYANGSSGLSESGSGVSVIGTPDFFAK